MPLQDLLLIEGEKSGAVEEHLTRDRYEQGKDTREDGSVLQETQVEDDSKASGSSENIIVDHPLDEKVG